MNYRSLCALASPVLGLTLLSGCKGDPAEASAGSSGTADETTDGTAGDTTAGTMTAESGSMDGSSGDGDGDGDSATTGNGDGDGDPTTSGDGDGDGDSATTGNGDGDGDPTTSGDGDGDGDGDPSTSGDGDGDGDGDPSTSGDGDGDGDGDCQVWSITYDLDGSVFDITDTPFGAGDASFTCGAPYDADNTIGPGVLTMYFTDVNGQAGGGPAQVIDYEMTMNFVTGSGGTTVTQTLETTAANSCGASRGNLGQGSFNWTAMPDILFDYTTIGNINCDGLLCGQFGAPPAGDTPVNDVVDINPFTNIQFSPDLSTLNSNSFIVSQDNSATTSMTWEGTEVSRTLVDAPACICN